MMKRLLVPSAIAMGLSTILLAPLPASAQLLGDAIFGMLNFGGYGGTNFFDPANGYVPGGSGPQPIATVVDPGIEFRYLNGYSGINANMTDNMVTLTQFGATGNSLSTSNSWYISFTNQDSADDFLGAELVSSDVPGATWSVQGNTLILSQPGYSTDATSVSMTFRLITETSPPAVPEPGTLALLGGGLGLGALKRLRRRRVH